METAIDNSGLPKATTMIFDEERRRRCSIQAGDPQKGCVNFHKGTCRPQSMFSARNCAKYTPMQS